MPKVVLGTFGDDGSQPVMLGTQRVGYIRKPQFGKGYFLYLDGVTWNNAPGARFTADAGGGSAATYAKSLKALVERAQEHFDNAEKQARQASKEISFVGRYQ